MKDEWFVTRDGVTRYGPFPAARLKELADFGNLQPSDMVWREGQEKWVRADTVGGLFRPVPMAVVIPPMPPSQGVPAGSEVIRSGKKVTRSLPWYAIRPAFLATIGLLFCIGGGCGALTTLSMDTTVAVDETEFMGERIGGGRVHNIGLMHQQKIGLVVSFTVGVLGIVFVGVAGLSARSLHAKH